MVSPVFHKYEFPNGDSISTDVPAQIVLSPMASITGLGIEFITISIGIVVGGEIIRVQGV